MMKIWLIENGKKTGPFDSFSLRERIEAGELPAGTLAWFEGAEDWMDIKDVPVLSQLYEADEDVEDEVEEQPRVIVLPESLQKQLEPPPLHLVRRFFARFLDISLYFSIVMIVSQDATVLNVGSSGVGWHLAFGLGYVLLDGLMIHLWRSSPGKWLLGIQVGDFLGQRLSLGASVMRALRVWVLGWGMWLIAPIAMLISGLMAWRMRYMVWDFPRRNRVTCQPLQALIVVRYIVALLSMAVLMEVTASDKLRRDMQEISEKFKLGIQEAK